MAYILDALEDGSLDHNDVTPTVMAAASTWKDSKVWERVFEGYEGGCELEDISMDVINQALKRLDNEVVLSR